MTAPQAAALAYEQSARNFRRAAQQLTRAAKAIRLDGPGPRWEQELELAADHLGAAIAELDAVHPDTMEG